MRGLPFFKPKKGAQFAGLGFSDGPGGGSYVLPPATTDTLGGVKVGNNLSIDANGVLSTQDGVDPSMIAGTESTTTSTHVYAIGEYFISSTGLLCKATSEIAIDDTISIGTSSGDNAISVTVGGELTELNSNLTNIASDLYNETQVDFSTGVYLPLQIKYNSLSNGESYFGYLEYPDSGPSGSMLSMMIKSDSNYGVIVAFPVFRIANGYDNVIWRQNNGVWYKRTLF